MAEMASTAESEAEAEAMIGAATATILSRADRRALRGVMADMVRGAAVLTRILRRRRRTRFAVRAVPLIIRSSARTLARRAARCVPITRKRAARVVAARTRRVLGSPKLVTLAVRNNLRGARSGRNRFRAVRG